MWREPIHAMTMVNKVIEDVQKQFPASDPQGTVQLSDCFRRLAGLRQWRWQLTSDPTDLDATIDTWSRCLELMLEARRLGAGARISLIAQVRVNLMLHLRIHDNDVRRPDTEQYGHSVLTSKPDHRDDPVDRSWLRWYQVIVLADQGNEQAAREKIYEALREDGRLNESQSEVGKRQYMLIRRFIETISEWFREPSLIGAVAQALQSRLEL